MKKQEKKPHRVPKLEEEIRIKLAKIISELAKEQGFIAGVNEVELDDGKKHAKVWLSMIYGQEEAFLSAVEKNKRTITSEMFLQMRLPYRLEFVFLLDKGADHAQKISEIIQEQKDTGTL